MPMQIEKLLSSVEEHLPSAEEHLLPLVEAVEQASGQRPHLSTVIRWCTRGSCGVRLESRVLGGRRYSCTPWVREFMERVTAAKDGHVSLPSMTPRQQTLAAIRAAKQLADRVG